MLSARVLCHWSDYIINMLRNEKFYYIISFVHLSANTSVGGNWSRGYWLQEAINLCVSQKCFGKGLLLWLNNLIKNEHLVKAIKRGLSSLFPLSTQASILLKWLNNKGSVPIFASYWGAHSRRGSVIIGLEVVIRSPNYTWRKSSLAAIIMKDWRKLHGLRQQSYMDNLIFVSDLSQANKLSFNRNEN